MCVCPRTTHAARSSCAPRAAECISPDPRRRTPSGRLAVSAIADAAQNGGRTKVVDGDDASTKRSSFAERTNGARAAAGPRRARATSERDQCRFSKAGFDIRDTDSGRPGAVATALERRSAAARLTRARPRVHSVRQRSSSRRHAAHSAQRWAATLSHPSRPAARQLRFAASVPARRRTQTRRGPRPLRPALAKRSAPAVARERSPPRAVRTRRAVPSTRATPARSAGAWAEAGAYGTS
jgi:hypothetical protein